MCGTPTRPSWQTRTIRPTLLAFLVAFGPACSGSGDDNTDADTHESSGGDIQADTGGNTEPLGDPVVIWTVRHAEKGDGDDPSLTEEGSERALALVDVMVDVPITAVYATDQHRTQETCQPTADDHGLEVVIDIDPEDDLADHVLVEHQNEPILHCGHSYTIPDFFDALGLEDEEDLSGYGQIWIVTAMLGGEASVEMSHFGE